MALARREATVVAVLEPLVAPLVIVVVPTFTLVTLELFEPVTVTDRSDGHIAHLDGLNLSKAWCWRLIAGALPESHPLRPRAEAAVQALIESALAHVTGDYMGEHWLASFALLALDAHPD